ncbi:hypothetical protein FNF27_08107 [Cafeteria roenbergensis]|uniref:IPT/TIG domain-containing protein n=1 Tax=Cafeteria roenbergensis TaxID=33653 RepID=A0A5A8DBT6_CAFRO|nr:hypothetical protein FNF27_08107 [Cafeteria roenbergensis]
MVFKGSPTALNFENVAARAFELTAVVTDSASNAVRRTGPGGVAWDVDVDPATAAVPNMYNGKIVDWRATHGTMDALSTGFAPPVVTSALIADASAAAFATQGGQRFVVRGQNFGPAFYARSSADGTGVESVPVTPIVRYGPVTGTENRAVDCAFVEGHTAIACNSVPGVGAGLKFVVSADGQSSEVFTSSLAYSPPTIWRVSQLVLATQGGDEVTLFGDNFGPIGTAPSSPSTTTTSRWPCCLTASRRTGAWRARSPWTLPTAG